MRKWKELDAQYQEARSLVQLERSKVCPGASGLTCPCLKLGIGLPGPDKSGHPWAWCHFLLPVVLLLGFSGHLSSAIGLTSEQPCPVLNRC